MAVLRHRLRAKAAGNSYSPWRVSSTLRAPWGAVSQRVRIPPGNCPLPEAVGAVQGSALKHSDEARIACGRFSEHVATRSER